MPTAKLTIDPDPSSISQSACSGASEKPMEIQRLIVAQSRRPSSRLIVVENIKDLAFCHTNERVLTAAEYLSSDSRYAEPGTIVINLCRGYKYLSVGYYCSLLAEARDQRAFPSVKTINDLSRKAIYSLDTSKLDGALNKLLTELGNQPMPVEFSMDIFFGTTDYTPLADLARQIFDTFSAPMMRVDFERGSNWHICGVKPLNTGAMDDRQQGLLSLALRSFNHMAWADGGSTKRHRYHVAVLHNPDEALPPSNQEALEKFIQVGESMDVEVSLIEKKDYSHLAEYDALFIRETTAINHHTYLFAKKAESEGLIVIDDPSSILRCTNKIYLADLLRLNSIPTPHTYVLQKGNIDDISQLEREIGYPMVMKIPDGAFSRGVSKASDYADFQRTAEELFKHSSLILVQQYLYTDFDWRIGVLNRQAIFASQYFMSKDHWQVAKRDPSGKAEFGMCRTVPLNEVPPEVLQHAVRAANLIGDSLYGVDMKMSKRGPVVIEVNDNPNIDQGIEDTILGDQLYRIVLQDLVRRIELKHGKQC